MIPSVMVTRDTASPLYTQIKNALQRRIETGELKPGGLAPSERDLAEQYHVSRMTARQALQNLANDGFILRFQGKGSFIAEPKIEESLLELVSFSEDMQRRGLVPSTKVVSVAQEIPQRNIAEALNIALGNRVVRIERLRLASGQPMALEISYIPSELCPAIEQQSLTGSLYTLLEMKYQLRLARAKQRLEGVAAKTREAALLEIEVGDVLLSLKRTSFDAQGLTVEYVHALYRADKYVFFADLER